MRYISHSKRKILYIVDGKEKELGRNKKEKKIFPFPVVNLTKAPIQLGFVYNDNFETQDF